jgi:hypothetical protein
MINAHTKHQMRVRAVSALNKYLFDQRFKCTAKFMLSYISCHFRFNINTQAIYYSIQLQENLQILTDP